jgi:hypothetical protein
MQILEEDDDLAYGITPDEEEKIVDGRPTWMKTLHTSVSTWMTLVPKVTCTLMNCLMSLICVFLLISAVILVYIILLYVKLF